MELKFDMGYAHSSCSLVTTFSTKHFCFSQSSICVSKLRPTSQNQIRSIKFTSHPFHCCCSSSQHLPLRCNQVGEFETQVKSLKTMVDIHGIDQELLKKMVYDALVWSSLHGLVVGDKSVKRSGKVPGVGLVHAPIALLPGLFPETHWKQACELVSIFNELVDRVSLDGTFIQESLSRTKKVDAFTSRLLDIHSKMLQIDKKEEIRLGLHRSDYMLDEKTKLLLQVELNTISCSFAEFSHLVSQLHSDLLGQYGEVLGLDSRMIPENHAGNQYAEALVKAWTEYNNPSAVIMIVVQAEERNMYDQHCLSVNLRKRHYVKTLRKTLAEIDREGELQSDGTLLVDGQAVAVVYYRAGYTPTDYPSESEWKARLLVEQSSAVKCPSISYHLVGTKKIQQELAQPNVLERFLDNKEDIAKIRKCFTGLWSLDDKDIVNKAIETPDLFIMKPQREGGGNNIYGDDVRKTLVRLRKEGNVEDAAYILMQRIFPPVYPTIFVRDGICYKDPAISELGIFGAYLRNEDKVIVNDQCGYLMTTKVSSSNEGGVAAGFAVLDSIYLT
ncbi:glutathione synthetase, chloroplastic-like [Cucurbita moschata]|uniref:Glutathione synthetase n=1 Tax=Cucurbita moschata TaxID=3662 RepID=A0A6J1GI97_CUCMO|nr:glutathione synthetase, chloroplastic-like [Cucurbita moschata]XP_022951295.1 glutathione synthetase, chloroplastic-like [Cucurbita moschata]